MIRLKGGVLMIMKREGRYHMNNRKVMMMNILLRYQIKKRKSRKRLILEVFVQKNKRIQLWCQR